MVAQTLANKVDVKPVEMARNSYESTLAVIEPHAERPKE